MQRWLAWMLFLFVLVNIADVATTWYGLSLGAQEANPLNIFEMTIAGVGARMIIVLMVCCSLWALFEFSLKDDSPIAEGFIIATMILVNVYLGLVVLGNCIVIGQLS